MKIQTNLTHRKNRTITYGSGVGKVSFDSEGIAEIKDEHFEILQSLDASIVKEGETKEEPVKVEEIETIAEEVAVDTVEQEVEEEKVEDIVEDTTSPDLSDMTVKELQAIAEEAELPKAEWSKLNKAKLLEYISGKLEE